MSVELGTEELEELDWAERRVSLFLVPVVVVVEFLEEVPIVDGRRMMVDSWLESLARKESPWKADSTGGILSVGFWKGLVRACICGMRRARHLRFDLEDSCYGASHKRGSLQEADMGFISKLEEDEVLRGAFLCVLQSQVSVSI